MFRVRTVFTGAAGTPYYSNLYFLGGTGSQPAVTGVLNFWTAIAGLIANDLTITVEGETAEINEENGDLVGFTALSGGVVAATSSAARMARATQGLLQFRTDGIVNSRRVRGRMFVPGVTVTHNSDGEPSATYISTLTTAYVNNIQAVAVRDTTPQVIWARPTFDAQGNVDRAGSNHLVQGWATWNEWAIQRSRRD